MNRVVFLIASALIVATGCCAARELGQQAYSGDSPLINTNINLVGADSETTHTTITDNVVINPASLVDRASDSVHDIRDDDIEEDPEDRFISKRNGALRPRYASDSDEWADDEPAERVLQRVKRCGGGGGDDDGDSNRSRRSRRSRRTRRARKSAAKNKEAKSSSTTTTVTRKVIQNGQVVSHTVEQGGVSAAPQQVNPAILQQPAVVAGAPIVQSVGPAQPTIIQAAQPAATVVQAAQPAVVQQQQAAAVPPISVNGSVQVGGRRR